GNYAIICNIKFEQEQITENLLERKSSSYKFRNEKKIQEFLKIKRITKLSDLRREDDKKKKKIKEVLRRREKKMRQSLELICAILDEASSLHLVKYKTANRTCDLELPSKLLA
ncbi:hypothetical protein LOAG_14849, partial [Loa loa]